MAATTPAKKRPVKKATRVTKPSDGMFEWTTSEGVVVRVPSMSQMDPYMDGLDPLLEVVERGNDLLTMAAQSKFIRTSFPEAENLGRIRASEFVAFMTAWQEFSGVELGESSAS